MQPDPPQWNQRSTPRGNSTVTSSPQSPPDPTGPPLPSPSLPKGGGAIRGIGEKFAANLVTGTSSLSVPLYTTPGRSGFAPQLSLSYDSGSGNSAFGFGWSLTLPAVTRKTDKGLPQYDDALESDVFILSGTEDLVPALIEEQGHWTREVTPARTVYGRQYAVHRYRPRVEGLFARIERWINLSDPRDTFWRSISRDNVTTWYGRTPESRIADPADPTRVFSWLICRTYDDKGNLALYEYKRENSEGLDLAHASERNRTGSSRSANHYIKRIFYGNRTPYFPDLTAPAETPSPTDWCFELVFDYGEHDLLNPAPQESEAWECRPDPFSNYRSTFEVRTYRLCRRALMFHHFPSEASAGVNFLVRSTDLVHSRLTTAHDPSRPFYSFLLSARQTGFRRDQTGAYVSNSLPPLEFKYTEAVVDETVREVDPESLENLPYGLDGSHYRWVDLNGEGISGILTEQAGSWFYKANLSPANRRPLFAPVELVAKKPSLASLKSGRQQLLDLSGDGHLALADFEGTTPGYFERTGDSDWKPFVNFRSLPVLDWRNPDLKFVDLTGDGFADLLISEGDAFRWYKSLSTLGFANGQRVPQALDEEEGPKLVFADSTESIFLADLSGDGLTDLVRVREGEVCYWPNLGYGRFGAKVTMDHAPWFDAAGSFDSRRIQLADIDGSGTADMVYFAGDSVHLYFNQSGNGWSAARILRHFPPVETVSSATSVDFLGNGTACLVWSSPLPGYAQRPMRYIDLMGGQKPHLLVHVDNNLGAETVVQYAPSTKFYAADKMAGNPWVTRLPFPVQVVEQVQSYDYVSRRLSIARYSYHHGYFDGVEREFRGFGRVDQWDTEEFEVLSNCTSFPRPSNVDTASNVPPVWTKTWFHTGAYFGEERISKHLQHEYYSEGLSEPQRRAMLLDDTLLPTTIERPNGTRSPYNFSGEERREACRALRGSILRQEVYGLDGSAESDRPYSVSERSYTIEAFQPQGPNRYGAFFVHARETIDFHYERKLFKVAGDSLADSFTPSRVREAADPRVTHALTLAVGAFGNVLLSASVGYARRYTDPALTPQDHAKQSAILCTVAEASYTNAVELDDAHRIVLPAESNSYELLQVMPESDLPGVTNLFRFEELRRKVQRASDGAHDVPYEDLNPSGLERGQPYRRLTGCLRTYYRPDDMGVTAGDPRALLPLGELESLGLPGNRYKLAFTPGLISRVYQRSADPLLPAPASVLGSVSADGGGYVDLDSDGHWWIPTGRLFYISGEPSGPLEKNEARQHFFLPRRFEDPFGNAMFVDYDPYDLLAAKATDSMSNVVIASNDYRVLAPALITDPNGNRAAVSFDALGLVAATAVMGKPGEHLGDLLTGFHSDLIQSQIDGFYDADDPNTLAPALLGEATSRVVYDPHRFWNSRKAAPEDPSKWQPAFAAIIARETHFFDLGPSQQSKAQITFSYSDGYARVIQQKSPSDPGPVVNGGPVVNPRWVGSGWTIFNNKGKPVRQYEPFFSPLPVKGHQFEFGAQVGVSPILCYDPAERVVATIHPNHTYEKVAFDPWHQTASDVNDTVLTDPAKDPDVGDFFRRLPLSDYLPTWYQQRSDGALGLQERLAAGKAAAHANTPAVAYFDSLGRAFLTVVDNALDGKYATRVELDIQNNQRQVSDALGRKIVEYDYSVEGARIHQASMDSDERWILNDVIGKPVRAFDSRGHNFRSSYDALRRPLSFFVLGTDPANSDAQTTAGEILFERIDYGEGQPNDQTLNLRSRVFRHYDQAGAVINEAADPNTRQDIAYDFKGNLLCNKRQFVQDAKALPNWAETAPILLDHGFVTRMKYDALNRVVAATTPDGSVVHPAYNEASLLQAVRVNLREAGSPTQFVTNIDYNAKGQRTRIEYGNQTETSYNYDPLTFRLTQLTTARSGFPSDQQTVQDLFYTFDPAGNITHIQDQADLQSVIYFKNRRVEPSNDYTYDALYRLIQSEGREQLGLNGGGPLAPAPTSYNDFPRAGLLLPGDGQAMGTYTEQYQYDPVGNFLQFIHRGANPVNPGWTRTYTYSETSLLEAGKVSNRLTKTTVGGNVPLNEPYTYDLHGNMTGMPQLRAMRWNFKDQLAMTQRQAVNAGDGEGEGHQAERTYYVYDATGQRVRKVTETASGSPAKERFYVGIFELYREYSAAGTVNLERETLNVMDDKTRIVVVETKTKDANGRVELPVPAARYQFGNHLGTACLELDESGGVITYEEYYAYGATSYQAGRTAVEVGLKRYRYIGAERDEETGFYYCRARYYASWLSRWISADPKGIGGGLNLYEYGNGNPVTLRDPNGMDPQPDIPKLEITKKLEDRDKADDDNKKPPPPAKDADSDAGLQYLTNGNSPSLTTQPGHKGAEAVVASGVNAAKVGGKLALTGPSSLTLAARSGLFARPNGIGAEYGVVAVGTLSFGSDRLVQSTALQGMLHLALGPIGIFGNGGILPDPKGGPAGKTGGLNLVEGGGWSRDQYSIYVNEILNSASKNQQISNQDVTNATSGTLLFGFVFNPIVNSSSTDAQPSASPPEHDAIAPEPSSSDQNPAKPNAFGLEAAVTGAKGTLVQGGKSSQSTTGTVLFFFTHAFDNKTKLFGAALGASYETGGGGWTGFLRIGIGIDRAADAPAPGAFPFPSPFDPR
jgi:RHS repeat-associated protein